MKAPDENAVECTPFGGNWHCGAAAIGLLNAAWARGAQAADCTPPLHRGNAALSWLLCVGVWRRFISDCDGCCGGGAAAADSPTSFKPAYALGTPAPPMPPPSGGAGTAVGTPPTPPTPGKAGSGLQST